MPRIKKGVGYSMAKGFELRMSILLLNDENSEENSSR